jgi:hypothetical protein
MPRRAGKSESVAQTVSAALLTIPGLHCSVFAPSSRAAGSESGLMGHVMRLLSKFFDVTKFHTQNHETLWIKKEEGDIRKFFAYPGNSTETYVYFLAKRSIILLITRNTMVPSYILDFSWISAMLPSTWG